MGSRQEMSRLLSAMSDALKAMTDSEFEHLLSGTGRLVLESKGSSSTKARSSGTKSDIREIADRLKLLEDREEAKALLAEAGGLRRADLVALARLLNVHVTKQHKVEGIRDSIVESVVGSRIRSKTIRSLPF